MKNLILLIIAISTVSANAAIDPQGLLKAKLFSFEAKIENLTGLFNCGNELDPNDQWITGLGKRLEEGSTDKHMGEIMHRAYIEELQKYKLEMEERAGMPLEKRDALAKLFPFPAPTFDPHPYRTQQAVHVEYLNYLVEEFSKMEKAAIILRAMYRLDRTLGLRREIPLNSAPGLIGRTYRLIYFMRIHVQDSEDTRLEPAFEEFAASFLTEEVIKKSLEIDLVNQTRALFSWTKIHNMKLYLFLWDKYHTYTTEENLAYY